MSYISPRIEPVYQRIDLETRDPRIWSETAVRQYIHMLKLSDQEFLGTLVESVKLAISNRDKIQLKLWDYLCQQRAANSAFAGAHGGPALEKWLDACLLNSHVDDERFEDWERKREYARPGEMELHYVQYLEFNSQRPAVVSFTTETLSYYFYAWRIDEHLKMLSAAAVGGETSTDQPEP